jgi:hypothetical protein
MPDPKNKTLKISLPAELYDQLEAAAEADDRTLDRYVIRMVKQYLEEPKAPDNSRAVYIPGPPGPMGAAAGFAPPPPGTQIFPTAPAPMSPTGPPVGPVILLATKKGGEGIPIDLMSDNALNGEPEELVNPNVTPVRVPKPNPNAPDMFGPSHRK